MLPDAAGEGSGNHVVSKFGDELRWNECVESRSARALPERREMSSVSEEEFGRVAAGLRWSSRNLEATRALLVDGKPIRDVADAHEVSTQQVRVLQTRFMARVRALRATKVSPDDYLASLATLDVFKPALAKLRRSGLSDEQLIDYLKKNDVTATTEQLTELLGSRQHVSPSKTRRAVE